MFETKIKADIRKLANSFSAVVFVESVFFLRSFSGHRGGFQGYVGPEVVVPAVRHDLRFPFSGNTAPGDANLAGGIFPAQRRVLVIFGPFCFPQIIKAVIEGISVNVVQRVTRKPSGLQKPNNPMHLVVDSVHSGLTIAPVPDRPDFSFVRFSIQFPALRAISEKFFGSPVIHEAGSTA